MTLEQAKLILASYRPNSSDQSDPAFQEALQLATNDPDLGRWLAAENAQDSAFAERLTSLPIPENLREELFELLASNIDSPGYSAFDQSFAGAVAAITPPPNLREEILAAMEVEQKLTRLPAKEQPAKTQKTSSKIVSFRAIISTAAAGLVAALLWSYSLKTEPTETIAEVRDLSPIAIETASIAYLSDDTMQLDLKDPRQDELYRYLASNDLPSPDELPQGLRHVPGLGCRKMDFAGMPASLVCYQMDPSLPIVHLIVMRREHVKGELPGILAAKENCEGCHKTGWSIAKWQDSERAFFMMSQVDPRQLAAVF